MLSSVGTKPAGVDFYASTMKVQIALLHEGDLLGFLHDLRESGNAYYAVRRCAIARTGQAVLEAQLAAWTVAITELSKEPFFAKVVASQKAWVKRTLPYLQINNMSSGELAAAYRHFFGV